MGNEIPVVNDVVELLKEKINMTILLFIARVVKRKEDEKEIENIILRLSQNSSFPHKINVCGWFCVCIYQ